jgi:hypothetical protein
LPWLSIPDPSLSLYMQITVKLRANELLIIIAKQAVERMRIRNRVEWPQ